MAGKDSKPWKVLIADFDTSTRFVLANSFRQAGYETVEAASALVALAMLEQQRVDVALLAEDLLARAELVRRLQAETCSKTPAILYSRATDYDLRITEGLVVLPLETTTLVRTADLLLRQSSHDKPSPAAEPNQHGKWQLVGQLAMGVIHDFNNIMTVILGYSEILKDNLNGKSGGQLSNLAEEIGKAAGHGASLAQEFLTFGRKNESSHPKLININDVLLRMESILRQLLSDRVSLDLNLHPELGYVWANKTQLEQIVLNLVVNAGDATSENGTVTLETENVEVTDKCSFGTVPTGSYVRLRVTDTGCGMSQDTMSHMFEPFFTTKESGRGTGLGLATVGNIIQQSGGHITVSSEIGRGSSFSIYLPQVDDEADEGYFVPSGN